MDKAHLNTNAAAQSLANPTENRQTVAATLPAASFVRLCNRIVSSCSFNNKFSDEQRALIKAWMFDIYNLGVSHGFTSCSRKLSRTHS